MPGNSSGQSTSWTQRLQATMQVPMRQRQCADSASHRSKHTCNNYAECATGSLGIRVNHCAKRSTSSCFGRSSKSTQSQTAKGCYQGCDHSKSSTGFGPPSSQPTGCSSTQYKRCHSTNKRGDPSSGQQCTVSDIFAKQPRPSWTGRWSRYRPSPSPSGCASPRRQRQPPTKQSSALGALRAGPAYTGQKLGHGPANGLTSSHDCVLSQDITRTDPHFLRPKHTWRQHFSNLSSRQGAHVKLFARTAGADSERPNYRHSGCHSTWCRSVGGGSRQRWPRCTLHPPPPTGRLSKEGPCRGQNGTTTSRGATKSPGLRRAAGQKDVHWAKETCSGPRRRPVGQGDVHWAKETCSGPRTRAVGQGDMQSRPSSASGSAQHCQRAPPTADLLGSAHVHRFQRGLAQTASLHRGLPHDFTHLFHDIAQLPGIRPPRRPMVIAAL